VSSINEQIDDLNVNVLVLGFPKCGTTAFVQWLEESKSVGLTNPKETYLLCPEFWGEQKKIATEPLSSKYDIRIEATTLNIYSDMLLSAVKDTKIKVIILYRKPEEVLTSWHAQMKKAGFYTEDTTLLKAYLDSGEGGLKDYVSILKHGYWSSKWVDELGHNRVLMINNEELRGDVTSVVGLLSDFFEIDLNLPLTIAEKNAYSKPRSQILNGIVRRPIFKKIWAYIEADNANVRKIRIWLRENLLIKKSEKNSSESRFLEEVDEIVEDQRIVSELYIKNRKVWK
jgi:hypothetical protein